MDSLLQDIRFALRTLTKAPLFTTLCVLCLSVGIGLNSNIYSAVYAVFQRPFPYDNPEELVSLEERNVKRGFVQTPLGFETFKDMRDQAAALEQLAAFTGRSVTITDGEEPIRLQGALISWNLFSMLGVRPIIGRHFRPDEDQVGAPGAVLLGYGVWAERYGADSAIIGRVLPVNGQPATVVGVMPKGFMFPEREEAWVPITPVLKTRPREFREVGVMGRLKDGATVDEASAQLASVSKRLAQEYPTAMGDWEARALPMRERFIDGDTKLVIMAMMGAVTFVLLIACANVANLLLARATSRGREIAVRSALGAGRGRIIRQLLTESIMLALIACPIGIGLAYWLLDIILASIPEGDMPFFFVFEINGPVLAYTVFIALVTGVVFGLAPALQASRGNLQTALKDGGRGSGQGGTRQRLRSSLAVAEVALSMVLLVGAALFVRSFMNVQRSTGGVEPAGVMTLRYFHAGVPYDSGRAITARVEDVIQRIEAIPGVESATASNQIPLGGGGNGANIDIEGKPVVNPADRVFVEWTGVTQHWFATLGVPMTAGRGFTEQEARDRSDVAVINQTMARRFWPDQGPLGRRFKMVGDTTNTWYTVIGVSRDYVTGSLDDPSPINPGFVLSYPRMPTRNTGVMIKTRGDPASFTPAIRQAIRASDPALPVFEVNTLEEVRRLGIWSQRLFGWMFAMFGIVALVLASVGVYGVLAYNVSQRTQEIGVRLALGASPDDVVRLVLRSGATLAGIGIVIGLAGAFGLTRVIQSLLVNVSSTDPLSFGGVTIFLTAVALFASYVPARRATRVDPLTALRSD